VKYVRKALSAIEEYSILLLIGVIFALLWANGGLVWADFVPTGYQQFSGLVLQDHFPIGHLHGDHRVLTLKYLVNDVMMSLFFALAGKEVWEATTLKKGSMRGKRALTPLFATTGGVVLPLLVYLGVASLFGSTTFEAIQNGWAVPTATDIAFAVVVGRAIFGKGHPAIAFLLLIAIVDDAIGLAILAIFYNTGAIKPLWLLLSAGAVVTVWAVFNWLPRWIDKGDGQRTVCTWVHRRLSFWPYLLGGAVSWYAFQESGLHPALGLLPMVLAVPHAETDFGVFNDSERRRHDLLNEMAKGVTPFMQVVLCFFGLVNAGVEFSALGPATLAVWLGLTLGKPVGIFLFGWFGIKRFGLRLPKEMSHKDLLVVGMIASFGFTVSLFLSGEAFPAGTIQDAAKMGALLSLPSVALAFLLARLLGIKRRAD
jgi:Na+:H+ antiporter, NhaA family